MSRAGQAGWGPLGEAGASARRGRRAEGGGRAALAAAARAREARAAEASGIPARLLPARRRRRASPRPALPAPSPRAPPRPPPAGLRRRVRLRSERSDGAPGQLERRRAAAGVPARGPQVGGTRRANASASVVAARCPGPRRPLGAGALAGSRTAPRDTHCARRHRPPPSSAPEDKPPLPDPRRAAAAGLRPSRAGSRLPHLTAAFSGSLPEGGREPCTRAQGCAPPQAAPPEPCAPTAAARQPAWSPARRL